ncbi:MAG: peptidylprolyl isomerase [Eubacteriales bacterium]|nr:peptidylprolyl isomerase [Eubacteriales bacterium]
MKKTTALLLTLCLAGSMLFSGCGSSSGSSSNTSAASSISETRDTGNAETAADTAAAAADSSAEAEALLSEGIYTAEITIKDYGTITVEMDAAKAPITVSNFVSLVKDGFYDGLTFHRIISGFMIQGGDPLGNGTGGSDQEIIGEFAANGITNDQSHTRGAVSMARSNMPDSASSQFFIVHEDSNFLDGQYACFGYVTSGMEIVDAICENTPVTDSNGTVQKNDQPVIESIRIVSEP